MYHTFDLLELNGENLRLLPYRARLNGLMILLASAQHPFIKYAETAFTTKEKVALWKRLKAENREGIVFKRLDAPYTPGKPSSGGPQLKFKFCATLSAVVAKVNRQRSVELQLLGNDGFRFVLGAEAELLAGGGVLVIKNTGAPEQDKTLFHDNAFLGHES